MTKNSGKKSSQTLHYRIKNQLDTEINKYASLLLTVLNFLLSKFHVIKVFFFGCLLVFLYTGDVSSKINAV